MFTTIEETNYDGLVEANLLDTKHELNILNISKALAHPLRLTILRQLFVAPRSIIELAQLNHITNSTVIFHLNILENATLVFSKVKPNKKGKTLIFYINFSHIHLFTEKKQNCPSTIYTQSIGVGNYRDAQFHHYARIATERTSFNLYRNDAFNTCRFEAQLLCVDHGCFTYAFSNQFAKDANVERLEFSFEICSESPYYRNDWKSAISFAVNSKELTTYLSPGDFGGRRGKLNPDWWEDKFTQYGLLVNLAITKDGIYLNGEKTNFVTLDDLHLDEGNRLDFSIYTKEDAVYSGGFNLFGKKFGNYEQDIVMKAFCRE